MSSNVDDLSIQFEENGLIVIKELDKVILSKGAWATLLFRYQQWDKAKGIYSLDKYQIRRYQKVAGEYRVKSKFAISSPDQARKLITTLSEWLAEINEAKEE